MLEIIFSKRNCKYSEYRNAIHVRYFIF